jgi:molecular chaperone GrpE
LNETENKDSEPAAADEAALEAIEPLAGQEPADERSERSEPGEPNELQEADAPASSALETELRAVRTERDHLKDQVHRRRAEFDNFRKRMERDRDLATTEAMAALFREFLPTVDNLERALGAEAEEVTLREGVLMIHREFLSLLERHGVTVVDPVGKPFDPVTQQALLHEEVEGQVDGTVVEAFRKSYHFRGRLLRPALVKVAKGKAGADPEDSSDVH